MALEQLGRYPHRRTLADQPLPERHLVGRELHRPPEPDAPRLGRDPARAGALMDPQVAGAT